jgi:HSP20 family protein
MSWRDDRDPMRQLEFDMHRFTEDALRAFLDGPGGFYRFWQPSADVHETQSGIVFKLELAGATVESISVALSGDGRQLTVSGSRIESEDERAGRQRCQQLEIYFGPFERTFLLPGDFEPDREHITATLKNGFLTITLPRKVRKSAPPRTIPIEVENE